MDSRRHGAYGWFGVTRPIFDPENRFVASPYLSPLTLSIYRLVIAAYMTACIIAEPILLKQTRRTRREARKFTGYFTNITFISLAAYFWVSGFYSLVYALTGNSLLRKFPRFLQLLHTLFYSTVTTFPFIVTAVFWSLISTPPHKKAFSTTRLQWSNVSFHCLNAVFAFLEVVFSAVLPQRWTHSLVILGIMSLYIAMAYIIKATAGFYVYDFMDTHLIGTLTAAYIFGIGAMGVVTFFVVQGIAWLKANVCGGRRVWKSEHDETGGDFDIREEERFYNVPGEKTYPMQRQACPGSFYHN